MQLLLSSSASSSKNVVNRNRPKLKGSGVVPLSPVFQKSDDGGSNNNDGLEEDDADKLIIYSVPNAKHYKIITTGCQMNVADSVSYSYW